MKEKKNSKNQKILNQPLFCDTEKCIIIDGPVGGKHRNEAG